MAAFFVTGGSGFIGGRLVRRLVSDGHRVRALARSDSAAARVEELGADAVRGDLADAASMRRGADGCEVAIHAAAMLAEWGPREDFMKGNVAGTQNALEACAAAGVRRFVHVGTEAALLTGAPLVQVDEDAPLRPDSPALYSATKALAEQAVRDASRAGFETVVVRPRLVWGPGDPTILPAVVSAVRDGRWAWIGGGRHLTSTTHVDNTVEGLVLAAERGRPGAAYFVTDGEPVEFREFVTKLLATEGVQPPERNLPRPVVGAAAAACEALWKVLPLRGDPPVTRLGYWLAAFETTIDISRARDELGYSPVKSREQGLAELRAA